jgi:hypothetical protein
LSPRAANWPLAISLASILHLERLDPTIGRQMINGLGGLNKSPNGVVIGLVQLKLPEVAT